LEYIGPIGFVLLCFVFPQWITWKHSPELMSLNIYKLVKQGKQLTHHNKLKKCRKWSCHFCHQPTWLSKFKFSSVGSAHHPLNHHKTWQIVALPEDPKAEMLSANPSGQFFFPVCI